MKEITKILTEEERKNFPKCHFCNGVLSVKYKVRTSPKKTNIPFSMEVFCCNKCALK